MLPSDRQRSSSTSGDNSSSGTATAAASATGKMKSAPVSRERSETQFAEIGESNQECNKQSQAHHEFIFELRDDDVVLGRGKPLLRVEGNKRFRELIRLHVYQYKNETGTQLRKDHLAKSIQNIICRDRGGRFLRKVTNTSDSVKAGTVGAVLAADDDDSSIAKTIAKTSLEGDRKMSSASRNEGRPEIYVPVLDFMVIPKIKQVGPRSFV